MTLLGHPAAGHTIRFQKIVDGAQNWRSIQEIEEADDLDWLDRRMKVSAGVKQQGTQTGCCLQLMWSLDLLVGEWRRLLPAIKKNNY